MRRQGNPRRLQGGRGTKEGRKGAKEDVKERRGKEERSEMEGDKRGKGRERRTWVREEGRKEGWGLTGEGRA